MIIRGEFASPHFHGDKLANSACVVFDFFNLTLEERNIKILYAIKEEKFIRVIFEKENKIYKNTGFKWQPQLIK